MVSINSVAGWLQCLNEPKRHLKYKSEFDLVAPMRSRDGMMAEVTFERLDDGMGDNGDWISRQEGAESRGRVQTRK
jgi:hypothetical protein